MPARIALFIDDLSHSSANTMMGVFNALTHYLQFPNLVFVVGLNAGVAQTLVLRYYKDHGYEDAQGVDYLNKIFQVECHIEPSHHQIRSFYENQIETLNNRVGDLLTTYLGEEYNAVITEAVLHLSRDNPRRVKLILNPSFA